MPTLSTSKKSHKPQGKLTAAQLVQATATGNCSQKSLQDTATVKTLRELYQQLPTGKKARMLREFINGHGSRRGFFRKIFSNGYLRKSEIAFFQKWLDTVNL